MSTFSKPFFRMHAGVTIAPESTFATAGKPVRLEANLMPDISATAGYAARIIFGALGQTVDFGPDGDITLSATGTRQVETVTVTAAAGATSNGNLTVTVTKAGLTGSPLAITVPLLTSTHTTAAKIASAIVTALNANAAFAAVLEALPATGAAFPVRCIYPAANDATFNLAITAGLGVSAAASSANTTAGVAGVVLDRPTASGKDVFGETYPESTAICGYTIVCAAANGATAVEVGTQECYGGAHVMNYFGTASTSSIGMGCAGSAIADVLIFTK